MKAQYSGEMTELLDLLFAYFGRNHADCTVDRHSFALYSHVQLVGIVQWMVVVPLVKTEDMVGS